MNFLFDEVTVAVIQVVSIVGAFVFYLWSSRGKTCSKRNFIITMLILGLSSFYAGFVDALVPVDLVGMIINLLCVSLNALFILLTVPSMMKKDLAFCPSSEVNHAH